MPSDKVDVTQDEVDNYIEEVYKKYEEISQPEYFVIIIYFIIEIYKSNVIY